MKILMASTVALMLVLSGSTTIMAFSPLASKVSRNNGASSLSMVLEKPKTKKLAKIESLKVESDHLIHPLMEVGFFITTNLFCFCFLDGEQNAQSILRLV